jgi:CNT family concentrative nucleoside transporter
MIGIPLKDCKKVGELMGTKMVVNEFVAYMKLASIKEELSPRGFVLSTFGLCGFANIS